MELVQVLELALEVLALGAVRGGADDHAAAAEREVRGLTAQAFALAVLQASGDAHALAGGRVHHVAPGDRQLHRQARALGLERVLDHLHDDLLSGLEQVGDLARRLRRARAWASRRPAARSRRRAGSRSSRGRCRRTRPPARAGRCRPCPCRCCRRSSVRRGALCRAQRRDSRPPGPCRACGSTALRPDDEREAAGVPLASRSATRVSARSTLTSTCFFNLIQSFGMETGRAPGGLAPESASLRAPGAPDQGAPRERAGGARRR